METLALDRAPGFGASTSREMRLRALAGGAGATALVVGGFTAVGFEADLLLLLAAAGAVGSVVSWLLERLRPSTWPEARYAVVGAALALLAALALAREDPGYLLLTALVAVPVGIAGGAAAAVLAVRLPERLLVPALCCAVLVLGGAAALAVERALPRFPGSSFVVEGATSAGSAETLAARAAAGLRAQPDPLSDQAWSDVASSLVDVREGTRVSIGYARTPSARSIDVVVDGDRACVEVRAGSVTSSSGPCR